MKTIATIALAVALGLAWVGAAIPATADEAKGKASEVTQESKDKAQEAKEKLKSAGRKVKDKAVEVKDKIKEKVQGRNDAGGTAGAAGSERVRSAQQALRDKGFNPGSIDGVMGPRTRAAIADFQRKQRLPTTGQLDTATMARLGMDVRTGSADSGAPSASPATGGPPAARPTTPEAPKR